MPKSSIASCTPSCDSAYRRCSASPASRTRIDSVSSSSSRAPGRSATASAAATRSTKSCLLKLQRRHVDRHLQRHARAAPGGRLPHRLAEHPFANGDDETRLLGHRDELRRRHLAQLRIAPAQQRFGADDGALAMIDLRLVGHAKALRGQRLAHRMVQPHARAQVGVVAGLVKAKRRAAALLGALHRGFGVADQFAALAAVAREQRDADAAGQRELAAIDRVAAAGDVEHASGRRFGAALVEPCTSSANWSPPKRASRSPCRRQVLMRSATSISTRSPIAAQAVVDLLEAIEVEQQQRETRADRAARAPAPAPARRPGAGGWAGRSAHRW